MSFRVEEKSTPYIHAVVTSFTYYLVDGIHPVVPLAYTDSDRVIPERHPTRRMSSSMSHRTCSLSVGC